MEKSTDNEIVKAWESVLETGDAPIGELWGVSVTTKLAKETFDMLNRQKAELERKDIEIDILIKKKDALKDEIYDLSAEVERLEEIEYMYNSLLK